MQSIRSLGTIASKSPEIVKFYYDLKSPFTYLSFEPALELEHQYPIQFRFIPWQFPAANTYGGNLKERDIRNWNKVRYLYLDARRFANERGLIIRGPERLFDSRVALIGGLFADKHDYFRSYARLTFERFFKRQLNLENPIEIEEILREAAEHSRSSFSSDHFRTYLNDQGSKDYSNAKIEADQDHIFGVPTFIVRDEPFWGNDRISWVKKKLDSLKLHDTSCHHFNPDTTTNNN